MINQIYFNLLLFKLDPESLAPKSKAIACRQLDGSHTGEALAGCLMEIFSLRGLDFTKITATVTDSATNFSKCFKDFGVDVENSIIMGKFLFLN